MDYKRKNLEVKKRMEKTYQMNWEEIWKKKNWSDVITFYRLIGGGCYKCGGYVTAMNLKFFNFDVEKALCYKCQNNY